MKAYLARLRKSQGPRHGELIGLFVAEDLTDLFWLIDQCCDPYACEYRPLSSGGIYLEGRAPKVPSGVGEEDDPIDWFARASLCEEWGADFDCIDDGWKNFDKRSLRSMAVPA